MSCFSWVTAESPPEMARPAFWAWRCQLKVFVLLAAACPMLPWWMWQWQLQRSGSPFGELAAWLAGGCWV